MSKMIRAWSTGLVAVIMIGCGGTDPVGPPGSTMQVRLVNAVAGGSDLRLVVRGVAVITEVAPGTASGFAAVPADATELLIQRQVATGSITVPIVPVAEGHFAATVMGDDNVLYATVATVAPADTGQAVPGRANFRAISLAGVQPAPEIDIHVTAPGTSLVGAAPAWQMHSALSLYSGLKDFAPGPLQVRITLRGSPTAIAQSAVLDVAANQVRVITLRHTGGNQFEIAIAVDQGQ
jgi:hypothetical protein